MPEHDVHPRTVLIMPQVLRSPQQQQQEEQQTQQRRQHQQSNHRLENLLCRDNSKIWWSGQKCIDAAAKCPGAPKIESGAFCPQEQHWTRMNTHKDASFGGRVILLHMVKFVAAHVLVGD